MADRTRNKSQRPKNRDRLDQSDVAETGMFAGRLKSRERRGWRQAGVRSRRIESVADHSWRVAYLAFLVAPPRLRRRAVELALLHDLPEAECGDITPRDRISPRRKKRIEAVALEAALSRLDDARADRIRDAFREYSAGTTNAARLVKSLDKVEMAMEALKLERDGVDGELLETFWRSARKAAVTNEGRDLMSVLENARRTGRRR